MRSAISLALVLSALTAASATACDCVIRPNGTGHYPTIQAAIDACQDGDVLWLADGVFTGEGNRDIDFRGKSIVLQSQTGNAAACIIDCEGSPQDRHRGFHFYNGEGPAAEVRRITITGGYAPVAVQTYAGGAVLCEDHSSPKFTDCVFLDNHAGMDFERAGGGVYVDYYSQPTFIGCVFRGNSAYMGGGLSVNHWSGATLEDCLFSDNEAVVGGGVWGCSTSKTRCVFFRNSALRGGAVWSCGYGVDYYENCTLTHNTADYGGAGLHVVERYGDPVRLVNTIISYSSTGPAIATEGLVVFGFTSCDLYGNAGGDWTGDFAEQLQVNGNFSADPCYCDPEDDDLHLCGDSWCLPENHPWDWTILVGALPAGCDPCDCSGPVPAERKSWGDLKSLFR